MALGVFLFIFLFLGGTFSKKLLLKNFGHYKYIIFPSLFHQILSHSTH